MDVKWDRFSEFRKIQSINEYKFEIFDKDYMFKIMRVRSIGQKI